MARREYAFAEDAALSSQEETAHLSLFPVLRSYSGIGFDAGTPLDRSYSGRDAVADSTGYGGIFAPVFAVICLR